MKINQQHPIAKHGLIVGQEVIHNGITYDILDYTFGIYELEPRKLLAWRKNKSQL